MSLSQHFFPVRRNYEFADQQVWTISHNLGRNPSVAVAVMYNGVLTVCLPEDIQHVDLNTVTVTFPAPQSGEVRIS